MKKIILTLNLVLFTFVIASAQYQMLAEISKPASKEAPSTSAPQASRNSNRTYNLSSFTPAESKIITRELDSLTPVNFRTNPDYGKLPENSPCIDCIELIQKRSKNNRYYTIKGSGGTKFYLQQGYSAINYTDANGQLRSINERLKPDNLQAGLYSALSQESPTKIDVVNKFSSLTNNGLEFKFNRNLRLIHKDVLGNIILLANADWTNYTIGSDGALVTNVFPDVDLKIVVFEGKIKTDFIVKKSLGISDGWLIIEDNMDIPKGLTFSTANSVLNDDGQWLGNIDLLDKDNRAQYRIHNGYAIDNSGKEEQMAWLGYKLKGNVFEIYLSNTWLTNPARQFPVTIDPLVSTVGTKLQAAFGGAGYDAVCTPTGCPYLLTVNTPSNCTITDIFSQFQFTTFNPCFGGSMFGVFGGFRINYLSCISPNQISCPGCSWGCAVAGPVICSSAAAPGNSCWSGNNGNFSSCVPAPTCAPYPMVFTMNFYQCQYPAFPGCNPLCYQASSNWIMTIQGQTVVQPPVPVSSNGTSMCNGMCTTITATGNFGVPAYSYSWNPGGATGNPLVVCPPINSTTTYTCIITDACGITATNQVAITTTTATLLTPSFAISMNPAGGTPCPVTLTACSLLPSNYGGGSENFVWNFIGGSVVSGGALSGSAGGPTYGGTGTNTLCAGSGAAYTIVYNSPGTYTLGVNIINGANCGFYNTSVNICPVIVLPLELTEYYLNYNGDFCDVNWTTASEKSTDYFLIEKSSDGINYTFLDKVQATGNSTQSKKYFTRDLAPDKNGLSYYRLKQFDKEKSESVFSLIETLNTNNKTQQKITVQPNPANSFLDIFLPPSLLNRNVTLQVFDESGKRVLSNMVNRSNSKAAYNLNIENLINGFYVLHAFDESGNTSKITFIKN